MKHVLVDLRENYRIHWSVCEDNALRWRYIVWCDNPPVDWSPTGLVAHRQITNRTIVFARYHIIVNLCPWPLALLQGNKIFETEGIVIFFSSIGLVGHII